MVIAGVAALPSLRAARELNAFPGISVPREMLETLERAPEAEHASLGMAWARRLIRELEADGRVAGVLLYPMAAHAQHIRRVCEGAVRRTAPGVAPWAFA